MDRYEILAEYWVRGTFLDMRDDCHMHFQAPGSLYQVIQLSEKRIYAFRTIEENLEEEIFLYKRKINFAESTVGRRAIG